MVISRNKHEKTIRKEVFQWLRLCALISSDIRSITCTNSRHPALQNPTGPNEAFADQGLACPARAPRPTIAAFSIFTPLTRLAVYYLSIYRFFSFSLSGFLSFSTSPPIVPVEKCPSEPRQLVVLACLSCSHRDRRCQGPVLVVTTRQVQPRLWMRKWLCRSAGLAIISLKFVIFRLGSEFWLDFDSQVGHCVLFTAMRTCEWQQDFSDSSSRPWLSRKSNTMKLMNANACPP